MLEKSFGLHFFLKQSKKNQTGERYVYLRITVDRISKELSTKRLWKTSRWNSAAGRAEGTNQDSKTLNAYLETLYFKALQAKKHLIDTDKEVSAEAIKNFLLGIGEKKRMIIEIFHDHNSVEIPNWQRIYRSYITALSYNFGAYTMLYSLEI